MKKIVLLVLVSSVASAVFAGARNNLWTRATFSAPVGTKFTASLEGQYRRQSTSEGSWMLDHDLAYSVRSWVHYRASRSVRLGVSPFAVFENYPAVTDTHPYKGPVRAEYRFAALAEWRKHISDKFSVTLKPRAEYRLPDGQQGILRLRAMASGRYQLSRQLGFIAVAEVLQAMPGRGVRLFPDQERLIGMASIKILPEVEARVGYMRYLRHPGYIRYVQPENNLLIFLTYRLPKHQSAVKAAK